MKKTISCLIILAAIIGIFGISVSAAPDSLAPDEIGNTKALITVTNPEGTTDLTFDNSYVISGYGEVGTVVTIYYFNADTGLYEKLYKTVTTVGEDGVVATQQQSVSCAIGESTLFFNTVNLEQGANSFMIYAEKDDMIQIGKFFIVKHNYNIIDVIRSWGAY
ncbi:MAG: hypothetical protein E7415_01890 [Ruminococcaceae bacterium]|nr:hypothetical protein [Oscillospiraceae bacterium]